MVTITCILHANIYFAVIIQQFDGVNCYGSYYVRKTQLLEAEDADPICVVQDWRDNFNYVELNIKLEQFIQRASNSQEAIVCQTRMFAVVVKFELISHEILLIKFICRKLTNERMMEHHKTIMFQELRSIMAVIFDANVSRLLDFVRAVANIFIIKASGVRLHNFTTEHLINDEIMDVFENGEKIQTIEPVLKMKKVAKQLIATLPLSHVAQLEAYLIDDVGVGTEYNYNVVL